MAEGEKKNKEIPMIYKVIGALILLLLLIWGWSVYNSNKDIPPAPGQPPVKPPTGNVTPPITVAGKTLFATVKDSSVTVYNSGSGGVYYEAKKGDPLGKVLGTDGVWTMIETSDGTKYVYTLAITTSLV